MVVDMLSLRAAAEKPPVSTTRLKTSRLVNRSIPTDYPLLVDNRKEFCPIIHQISSRADGGWVSRNPATEAAIALGQSHLRLGRPYAKAGFPDYPLSADNPSGISLIIDRAKKTDSPNDPIGDCHVRDAPHRKLPASD